MTLVLVSLMLAKNLYGIAIDEAHSVSKMESHAEIWDDSALVNSWNEALKEYVVCRKIIIDPRL